MTEQLKQAAQKNGPEVELCEQMQRAQSRVRLLKPDDFDAPELDLSDSHTALFALAEYWKGKYDKLNALTTSQPAQAGEVDERVAFPDECVASGQSCQYGPNGQGGETQCRYCGSPPSLPTQPAAQATPDDSFVAISFRIDDISPEPTEDFEHINCQFNGIDGTAEARRVDDNTVDIGRVVAFAQATPEPVPADQAKWCEYVAGMVDCWVSAEWSNYHHKDEDLRVKAIAGIIERRLWAMSKPATQAPQQAAGDPVGEPFKVEQCMQVASDEFDAFLIGGCKGEPPRMSMAFASTLFKTIIRERGMFFTATHPAPGVPEVDFVGYVSPEALEELRISGESASIHHWRAREDFVAVYVRRKPGAPGAISELLAALGPILAAVSTNDGDSMGHLESDKKVLWTVSSSWSADVRVTLGDLRKIALAAAQAKGADK